MTSNSLLDHLELRIKEYIKRFNLHTIHDGLTKAPDVFIQYLPPKQRKNDQVNPDYPHIIIRYVRETVKDGINRVKVLIIAGVFNEDHQVGSREALNILTRIKNELIKAPTMGAFQLIEEGLSIDIPEEQVEPQWIGFITAEFIAPKPMSEEGFEYVD